MASGAPRFRAKHMPTATLRPELHTETSREIELFCLADDTDTFILHNWFVGGDVWSDELGDYTQPVWETVVLRSSVGTFENIATGPESIGRLEWSDGSIAWNTTAVELLQHRGDAVTFAIAGALVHTTNRDGSLHDFLVELELTSQRDEWRLKRSGMGPSSFTLARQALTPNTAA